MAETHETIADIIAWLRLPRDGENGYLTAWRDEIADRLEAAHKRDYEYPKAQSLDADKLTGKNISGLVADLRQIAKYHYARGYIVQGQFARVMADRLEAAWKREKAAIEADTLEVGGIVAVSHVRELSKNTSKNRADFGQLGDAAKLREAVKAVVDVGYPHNFQHEAPHISGYCYDITRAIGKCFAALSAPPRNCDVYNNESCRMAYHLNGDGLMTMQAFADWLFAPATEQKGGADEQK